MQSKKKKKKNRTLHKIFAKKQFPSNESKRTKSLLTDILALTDILETQ